MTEHLYIIYGLILLISCLYSSVGHGGASGYLALMSLFGVAQTTAKPVALVLNIVVSIIAFVQFYRSGYFDKKIFLTLAITSVPAAFLGGLLSIHPTLYKQILGGLLLLTAIRLLIPQKNNLSDTKPFNVMVLLGVGAGIGFISGMIGIGGGIILSPILILLGYSNIKTTAGISALFIFVNSIAGLLGQLKQGIDFSISMYVMILVAVIGGVIGSYLGANRLGNVWLKKVLGVVLIVASIKLILVS